MDLISSWRGHSSSGALKIARSFVGVFKQLFLLAPQPIMPPSLVRQTTWFIFDWISITCSEGKRIEERLTLIGEELYSNTREIQRIERERYCFHSESDFDS